MVYYQIVKLVPIFNIVNAKDSLTDEQLIALIKAGDQFAFTETYRRYNSLLLRHAIGKLDNPELSMDVVQDVFVKLWQKREDISISDNLIGYLYRSVRNQIFDHFKHAKVVEAYSTMFRFSQSANSVWADHYIREKQFAAMIQSEIDSLPSRMREVFVLRKIENLSTKDTASRLGITENTVSDQLKKAMKILKIKIGLLLAFLWIISRLCP